MAAHSAARVRRPNPRLSRWLLNWTAGLRKSTLYLGGWSATLPLLFVALPEAPPARIERVRGGRVLAAVACPRSIQPPPKRLPARSAPAACPTAAERAVRLRRNALRSQHAASRAGRGSSGCHSSPLVDPAIAEATADTERSLRFARTAAERALVRPAQESLTPAARRLADVPPKRSPNFRRRGSSACGVCRKI
jgi:hypothetical protein